MLTQKNIDTTWIKNKSKEKINFVFGFFGKSWSTKTKNNLEIRE